MQQHFLTDQLVSKVQCLLLLIPSSNLSMSEILLSQRNIKLTVFSYTSAPYSYILLKEKVKWRFFYISLMYLSLSPDMSFMVLKLIYEQLLGQRTFFTDVSLVCPGGFYNNLWRNQEEKSGFSAINVMCILLVLKGHVFYFPGNNLSAFECYIHFTGKKSLKPLMNIEK